MTTIGPRELSPRQREILALVAAGRTSKEIAAELQISESTVNWHLANAFERLGASSRAEAVALAMREDVERANGNGAGAQDAPAPRAARHPALPLSSIALAFAVTLLLGLIGGALIAEWNLTAPPPSPSASPNALPSRPTVPSAQPLRPSVP
ncbi:MAG TPA: helix-turn-helix transcriptional regulator [Candidatus Limnocylindria bacterium]|nr:helix-turn-helix transcriptional regulator [Candidatus Limnocylindria bacterium]